MKKSIILTAVIAILIIVTWIIIDTKSYEYFAPINTQTPNSIEKDSMIKLIDTSLWKRAQIHQNISILIPQEWSDASDGVYNYDHTKTTGIRDPNFPTNSFKCVFYKDTSLRSQIKIEDELTLNKMPKVTFISGKWNDQTQDIMRQPGEDINIYTYFDNTDEIYIECTVFKGELLAGDKNILENIILSIQSQPYE